MSTLKANLKSSFFKFQTSSDKLIYKYCSLERFIMIIKERSIYYSTADEFNDPFELSTDLYLEHDNAYYLSDILKIEDPKLLAMLDRDPSKYTNIFKGAWEKLKKSIGISCFSMSPLITLMWAHYGDKYKGVCVGFDFDDTNNTDKIIQMPVHYIDTIEKLDYWELLKSDMDTDFVYKWLLSKSKVWNYEKEVRRIYIDKKGLLPIDIKAIKVIYVGLRMTNENLSELIDLLKRYGLEDIKIVKTEIHSSTYSIGVLG